METFILTNTPQIIWLQQQFLLNESISCHSQTLVFFHFYYSKKIFKYFNLILGGSHFIMPKCRDRRKSIGPNMLSERCNGTIKTFNSNITEISLSVCLGSRSGMLTFSPDMFPSYFLSKMKYQNAVNIQFLLHLWTGFALIITKEQRLKTIECDQKYLVFQIVYLLYRQDCTCI